jgi:hypothetical protein
MGLHGLLQGYLLIITASFVIKSSEKSVPVLKSIFNLSLSQNTFPNLWKQAAIVSVLKKCRIYFVCNYRPVVILKQCFQIF